MYAFKYHRPPTARTAATLVKRYEDAKFLAGGHTLLPTMKQRLAQPGHIIDLGACTELRGIERKGRNIVIGAMTRHADVASSAVVQEAIPALAQLAAMIGDPAVRNRGTLGGSVANNDPAADYPAACLALNALIVTNKRKILADAFFIGMFETALEDGEIILKISFPIPAKAGYAKFRNPASRYALVGVFVSKKAREVRVAVTGAGEKGVFRSQTLEGVLTAKFGPKSLDGVTIPATGLNSDMHADAAYRAHLITVMARRAVMAAL